MSYDAYDPELIEVVGDLGIFETFLGTYSVANLQTHQICSTLNFLTIEDAKEYINNGVEYIPQV